jgi:hypothetical protein
MNFLFQIVMSILIPDCDVNSVQDVYLEVVMYRLWCSSCDCLDLDNMTCCG